MTSPNKTVPTFALVFALFAAACTSPQATDVLPRDDRTTTTQVAPPETASHSAETTDGNESVGGTGAESLDIQQLIQRVGTRYAASDGLWPGFVPNEHPVVIALKDSDNKTFKAIVLNVADPSKLGDATELDTTGTPITTAHEVTNLNDDTKTKLDGMQHFDFHMQLAGVDSFAITAGPALDASEGDYAATLIHELFHRWQDGAFQPNHNFQDIAGYNYTKENLELAVLEQRALTAAIDAGSEAERMTAARHYAALRMTRTKADPRIILDNGQEQVEGSARYLEHVSHTEGGSYGKDDFTSELGNEFATSGGIKDWFGFGRFYSTGAAAIHLATQLGDDDALRKISAEGAFPGDLVVAATGVSEADLESLVKEARAAYDADGSVAEQAAIAAEKAKSESGDIFGGAGDGSFGDGEDGAVGAPIELTAEQIDCLDEADIPASGEVPDEVFNRCIGG